MTTHAQWVAAQRAKAGLPVLLCPNCGGAAAHWIPESLERPGRYSCDPSTKGMTS